MAEQNSTSSSSSEADLESKCTRTLGCGHPCGGVVDEIDCLPCLYGCEAACSTTVSTLAGKCYQRAHEMCVICYVDTLSAAPAIQLTCGHIFHFHCMKNILAYKWNGTEIKFEFLKCPLCKAEIMHVSLESILKPLIELRDEVICKALDCLERDQSTNFRGDEIDFAMENYDFFQCIKCHKVFSVSESLYSHDVIVSQSDKVVCRTCDLHVHGTACLIHGTGFMRVKCRFCCGIADIINKSGVGLCKSCNAISDKLLALPTNQLPHCPAGPGGVQLEGSSEDCPLQTQHPPAGCEAYAACAICSWNRRNLRNRTENE